MGTATMRLCCLQFAPQRRVPALHLVVSPSQRSGLSRWQMSFSHTASTTGTPQKALCHKATKSVTVGRLPKDMAFAQHGFALALS